MTEPLVKVWTIDNILYSIAIYSILLIGNAWFNVIV